VLLNLRNVKNSKLFSRDTIVLIKRLYSNSKRLYSLGGMFTVANTSRLANILPFFTFALTNTVF
jgi:hypothetical protein